MLAAAILLIAFLYGAWTASFIGLLAYRLPRGEKWAIARSHCDACGHVLNALDLFPCFGWLARKGKCHYCGMSVPARYPLMEALFGVVFAGIIWCFGLSVMAALIAVNFSVLFLVALTYGTARLLLSKTLAATVLFTGVALLLI